jgi:hypothetical protein
MEKDAEFRNLRAFGAFLVGARLKNGTVEEISVTSEAGGVLKMNLPWTNGGKVSATSGGTKTLSSSSVEMPTAKGEVLIFKPL